MHNALAVLLASLLGCGQPADTAVVDTGDTVDTDVVDTDPEDTDTADTDVTDSDTDSDSDTVDDTDDTDTDDDCPDDGSADSLADDAVALAAIPAGSCEALLDPWVIGDADDVRRVWEALGGREWWIFQEYFAPEYGSCPCADASEPGPEWNCTTSTDWTVAGLYDFGSETGGTLWNRFDGWAISHDDSGGSYVYLADGDYTSRKAATSIVGLREKISRAGSFGAGLSTTRVRHGDLDQRDGWSITEGMYLRIVEDDHLPIGDLCVSSQVAAAEGCYLEPVGTFRITGAQEVIATFDGDVTCDGCGEVTVDGAALGTVCGPPSWY